jgi:hypothetical protein
MQAGELLAAINARHDTHLALGERFANGEQGAFAVVGPDGRRLVLKWVGAPPALAVYQHADAATKSLRDKGYPAPIYVLLGSNEGVAYAIHEELPGAPMGQLRADLLPQLLELNALQARAARSPNLDWPGEIVRSILHGCDGYCVIDSLRAYSAETMQLLTALQEVARASADVPCPRGDIVHYDFNPANILVHDDRVSGVIDWDGVRSGDCAFDLATLLFYTHASDIQTTLWEAAGAYSSPKAVRLYLSHMIVRQVDWTIRHYDAANVVYWLEVSRILLRRFGVTTS